MSTLADLPYVALRFDKTGTRVTTGPLHPSGVTDLVVISHGWHQDPGDAEGMYAEILGHVQAEAHAAGALAGRTLGVVGIYWPSDRFRDDLSDEAVAILGAAAAVAGADDADLARLQAQARALAQLFGMADDDLADRATYAANGGAGDADDLVATLRAAVGDPAHVDAELRDEHAEVLDAATPGRVIVQHLRAAGIRAAAATAAGGTQAAALGLDDASPVPALGFFSGPVAAVATVLNQFAYFELKKRAGKIGLSLGKLLTDDGLAGIDRVHFIGHSFGARLVSGAASVMSADKVHSLTLLQGAFSHNGLGVDIKPGLDGAFRAVVRDRRVGGRIAITHTWNDRAVGLLYALASRASNDIASGFLRVTDWFGGGKDIHGGMGANGALRLKDGEGAALVFDGHAVPHLGAYVNSLKCDFITGHTDIRTASVARVIVAALK